MQPTPAIPANTSPVGNNPFADLIPASAAANPFGDLIPAQSSAVAAPNAPSSDAPDAPANASHAFPAAVQAPGNANAPADLTSSPSSDSAASSGGPQASGNPFSDLIPKEKPHGVLDTARLAGTALRDAAGAVAENIVGGVASLVPLAAGGLNAIVQGISHPGNFMQAAGQGLQSGEAAVENSKLYQLTQPQTELGKKVQNLIGEGFQKLTDLGAEGMAAQTELQAAVYDKLGLKDLAHWTRTHGVPIAAGVGAAAVNAPLLVLGAHAPEVREAVPEEAAPSAGPIASAEPPARQGAQQIVGPSTAPTPAQPEARPVQPSSASASNSALPAQAEPPAALPDGAAAPEPIEGDVNTGSRIDDYVRSMPHADQKAMSAVEAPAQPTGMRRRSLSFAPVKPVSTVSRAADDIKRALAPATRGPYAEQAAGIVRAHNAQLARSTEVADAQLNKFKFMTARLQPAERLDFIDAIETGRKQPNTRLQPLADTLGSILEDRRKKIQDLGKGQLQNYIENYFPHLWQQKPEQVREILSKRSLTGPGSFLKERKIPTTREGIDMGLVPVTDNPIELTLLKTREMDRYLMGQHIFRDLKEQDLARFVPFDKPAPSGWSKVNDKIAQVFLPPEYKIREAYDEHLFNQLNRFAHSLGIDTQRAAKIGGRGVWGYTSPDGAVVTRFAGPETVLTHEIGHQLDFKYGLGKKLVNNPATREELRKLADLRYEGKETTEHFKHYVRQSSEKIANLVHAFVHARERLHEVAPHAEAALVDIINAHPELKPLLDIKPSLVLGQAETTLKLPGIIKVGEYYAPDQAAHVINNFLSPGLRGNAVYDAARALSSAMNTAQLGLSAFHLGFTTMDTMISRFALGVKQLMEGRLAKGAANLVKGISPTTPVENYLKGGRLRKAYLSGDVPENATIAAMVDALVQSGGRVKMDSFYRMSAAGSFRNALLGGQYGRAAKLFIPRLVDMINAPIFEHIVPRQKLGVFMELAKDELATHPDMDLDQKRRALAKVWDSVDNRMGQMVYDNLFWNKALKDLGMISVRSMGWNLGTFRELGGGAYDLARLARNKEFTHRMAYIVALPVVTGLYGAMYQYLKTGQGPQELKDYFFPRTGAFRPDGNPDRVSLPSYMKDVYEYAHAPAETLLHKTNPLISTIGEMLQNEDFYGAAIRNPNDPLVKQAQDEWNYAINQFKPFSVRNFQYQNRLKGNAGGVTQYLTSPSFYGIVPSPAYITRSDEENRYIEERHMRPALRRKFREEYKLRR